MVSVNVSQRPFDEGILPHQVGWALAEARLPGDRFEIEISAQLPLDVSLETLLTLSKVRDVAHDREHAAIARSVIETEQQRAFLAASGCDDGQGHLFGHPMPTFHLCLPGQSLPG